ncbi:MAG TPA: class I SAM-dependent methyltransferase [Phytomonospora sp.]
MRTNYTEVFRDEKAVEKYEREVYAPRSFSTHVSARQRQWLRAFTETAFERPPTHHDFACGTGRALRMLDGLTSGAHGYDTSEAMLSKARELGVPAELHLVGETGPLPASADGPNLVTIFRLLLNAPREVRDRAMEFAAGMLPAPESGLLIVENHGNAGSLRHLRKAAGRVEDGRWFAELSHGEVAELFARHGFELLTRQGFTLLTQGFYKVPPVSWVAPGLDSWASRRSFLAGCATNVLYIARRIGLGAHGEPARTRGPGRFGRHVCA